MRGALATLPLALALGFGWSPVAAANPSPSVSETPNGELSVHGQVLAIARGYLIFTTGDAVRLDPSAIVPKNVTLGRYVRATLDQTTGAVKRIVLATEALPGDVEAAQLPSRYVVVDPAAARASPGGEPRVGAGSGLATITLDVRVPDSTPQNDDIYLSTDRSNYGPSEVRMQRVDAQHWTIPLQIPTGATLRYRYTRGNFTNVERDRRGGIAALRVLPVIDGARTHDVVARWADQS